MNNKKRGKERRRLLPGAAILAESAMFGDPLQHRWPFLVVIMLLGCATTASSGKNLCNVAPDESTMLQVVKPVARTLFKCVDEVILAYKVRGEVASAVLQLTCEEYLNCAGKIMGKKATKEGRNETILCLIKYVEQHLPPDLPTGDHHEPRELVAPILDCLMKRLDLPLENEKKANAAFHWFFEIVRP
ncbi:uncharacterized protein LOC119388837 [Rhipicephalus sanguineus]|uniref:uncharacterized protein LOC119388837 n=1 Tax=Rhipicephalus sanguineus TaxID=34632 RepID=UPI00189498E9|nr:uncharacterized protein LOC119388837 [Rhipicephalus sanguineus]